MSYCCVNCFSDPCIQQFIRDCQERGDCDYCGSEDTHIVEVNELAPFLREGVERVYEDAAHRVAYENAEGGYDLATTDMADILHWEWEVFSDTLDDPTELLEDLGCHGGTPYVRRDPYGPPSGGLEEISKWEEFCTQVKEERRYTIFFKTEEEGPDEDSHDLGKFLRDVARAMEEHLTQYIEPDTQIYRARRKQSDQPFGHKDLTSPPRKNALNSRMSPAGISVFYGALDGDTALAEVRPGLQDQVAIAQFKARKHLRVLDFSQIPPSESPFSEEYWFGFEEFIRPFLSRFSEDIARPIRPEDSPVEYTPTQIFSEFIRVFLNINGILYRSSMRPGGVCTVFFEGPEISCESDDHNKNAWLTYVGHTIREVRGIQFSHVEVAKVTANGDANI